jgi:peptide/nickel transport system permease protein
MSGAETVPRAAPPVVAPSPGARRRALVRWQLVVGLTVSLTPLLVTMVGSQLVGEEGLRIAAALPGAAPSSEHLLGSDTAGRDILVMIMHGTPPTYLMGIVAGLVAVSFGTVIGVVSGYVRGSTETLARGVIDVALGIPPLAVVVALASILGSISPLQVGLIIGMFGWAYPARQIRSQVLSLREQQFVFISKLSNEQPLRIMFAEILPNVVPFVVSSFVAAVSFSIVVAVGLQLLGIGGSDPTLGLVLQLAVVGGALSRGMWWWWAPPAVILVCLFLGLFLVSTIIDQYANPRLRELRGFRG